MDNFGVFSQLMLLGLGLTEEVPQTLKDLLAGDEARKNQCLKAVYQLSQEQGFPSVVYDGLQKVFAQGAYTIEEDLNYDFDVSYALFERQDEEGICIETCYSVLVLPNIR